MTQAEASVILVFSSVAEALDLDRRERDELAERLIMQLSMLANGHIGIVKSVNVIV